MSDTEEVDKSSRDSVSKRLRRKSIEMDISELVRNNKIQTKSNELKRQERYLEEFDKEMAAIDSKSENAKIDLEHYETLQKNMQAYFADELVINMDIDEHRQLTAFLKTNVSILCKCSVTLIWLFRKKLQKKK